jgi:hypothetical protein
MIAWEAAAGPRCTVKARASRVRLRRLAALTALRRVAKQVAGLDPDRERDALQWIESVSEFDADATR